MMDLLGLEMDSYECLECFQHIACLEWDTSNDICPKCTKIFTGKNPILNYEDDGTELLFEPE